MVVELFLDEEKVDLDDGTTIAETKQINDFFEIADRQTSYTNTFKLPKTERNKMLLGGHGIAGVTSLAPYRLHKVSVYRNGLPTIQGGIGYLKETSDSYNMYVYSENISMFDTLGDKTLADLNLQPLTHELNLANWYQSFSRNDYVYALADYGKLDSDVVEVNYQVPSLYVKYLWHKIFQESGFQWEYFGRGGRQDFSPFQDSDWEKLAITINQGLPQEDETLQPELKLKLTRTDYRQHDQSPIQAFLGIGELPDELTQIVNFRPVYDPDNINVTYPNAGDALGSRIRIEESGFYKINLSGEFNNINTEKVGLYFYKNGISQLFTVEEEFTEEINTIGFSQTTYFQEGDLVSVNIKFEPVENDYAYAFSLNLDMYLDNSITIVNFGTYLGNIKQKDFLKDIIQYYGLMFRRVGSKYQFMSIQELLNPNTYYINYNAYDDHTVYDDWSDKFNNIESLDTNLGSYAQKNWFRYKYDNQEDTWADDYIGVDDYTLENEKTQLTRIYKAPLGASVYINGSRLRKCDFFEKELNDDGSIKSVKPKKGDCYFSIIQKKQGVVSYKLADATNAYSLSGLLPYMSFTSQDFNSLLAKNYASFTKMLTYAQKYTVKMHLNVADIHTLDFFKLKYIKQLGGLFYVNKIADYKGAGLTKVELIKVRSLERLGEFDNSFSIAFSG